MKKNNCYRLGSVWLLVAVCWLTTAAQPSQSQFEKERAVLLQRIQDIQKILQQTATQRQAGMGQLKALNGQIESNALLLQTIGREIKLLNQALAKTQRAMANLAQDLAQLKKEYAAMVYVGAKAQHDIHQLMFLFAAPSFHALVQRLRHVKQYARTRQRHFHEIEKIKATLQAQHTAATQRMHAKRALLQDRQVEKAKLHVLKTQQTQLIGKLEERHTELAQELKQRNQAVKRLDKLITDTIQQELQAQAATPAPSTPSSPPAGKHQRSSYHKLSKLFRKSRGKLPWPVKTGFISSKFGIRPHPVLRDVKVENLGIDIQTQAGAQACAIFEGVVKAIAFVPGMNQVVIIQHGAYHSVYARLKQTQVKVGQYVTAQTPIGIVHTDGQGTTELQLQLWKGTQKLNPAWWLRKR